jgi:hypothetical protein
LRCDERRAKVLARRRGREGGREGGTGEEGGEGVDVAEEG